MSARLTREQFIAQFPDEITGSELKRYLVRDEKNDFDGIEAYRALQKVIIKIDGRYFCKWN